MEENATLEAEALEYQALLGSGEQLARTLEVLDDRMPEEYWLQRLESRWTFDEELGVDRALERPILHLEGRARQGTGQMSVLHAAFLEALRDELPDVSLKSAPRFDGSSFELDMTLLAIPEPPPEGGEATDDGEEL